MDALLVLLLELYGIAFLEALLDALLVLLLELYGIAFLEALLDVLGGTHG